MHKLLLFLALLLPINLEAITLRQSVVEAKAGDQVTITWELEEGDEVDLLYFTIRRSELISGKFDVWKKVAFNQRGFTWVWISSPSRHYFITAWYAVVQPDGTTKAMESVGSNQVKVSWK